MTTELDRELENYSFMANPKLKKPGVKIEFLPEHVAEFEKCARDPIYFIETYVVIEHVDKGIVPFKLFAYQKKFIRLIHKNRFVTARMARQMGKSTTLAAYLCWYVIFNDNKGAAILANKAATAIEILSRVQMAYENLPLWLQQGVTGWNQSSFKLENGSRVRAFSTSSSAIRGFSISFLFIDEVAHIPKNVWDKFYNSVYSTVTSGKDTKIVMVSTPLGLNHFYELHDKAERGESSFKPINVLWNEHPDRDEKWKAETIANTSEAAFAQEHEVSFLGSSLTLINATTLFALKHAVPLTTETDFRIYEKPEKDHAYMLTADVGEGVGQDSSTFHVIDISQLPYRSVATYQNNTIQLMVFADLIVAVAKAYNDALVLVENNAIGGEVLKHLWHDHEYENVLFGREDKNPGERGISHERAGIRVTSKTKRVGCVNFKLFVERGQLEVCDFNTIREMKYFVRKKDSFAAEAGYHDDLVMPLVNFSYYVRTKSFQTVFEKYRDVREAITQFRKEASERSLPAPVIVGPREAREETMRRESARLPSFRHNTIARRGNFEELEPDEQEWLAK